VVDSLVEQAVAIIPQTSINTNMFFITLFFKLFNMIKYTNKYLNIQVFLIFFKNIFYNFYVYL